MREQISLQQVNLKKRTNKVMEQESTHWVSLFDYLGKPARRELGAQVYQKAKIDKVKVKDRQVETSNYKGKVILYPYEWLHSYFRSMKPVEGSRI